MSDDAEIRAAILAVIIEDEGLRAEIEAVLEKVAVTVDAFVSGDTSANPPARGAAFSGRGD